MKAKSDIVNLGERYRIETPHTRYVTRLALALFDGFKKEMDFDSSDRNLLFAAGRLHDIGYDTDPQHHVIEAARILRENPIESFSQDAWRMVIGIVLLHKRDWRSMLNHEAFPQVDDVVLLRIKRLAALLRVADGLDHSHVQDAGITYCRRGKKVDKIGVHCTWYENNIPWAEGKADLWECVFKRPFRIEGSIDQPKHLFKGIVHKKDTAIGAARRILCSQACIMRDNTAGLLDGSDLRCLHDYRDSMDRFRAALRMFKPLIEGTAAVAIDLRLKALAGQLSPLGDLQAVLQLVHGLDERYRPEEEIVHALQSDLEAARCRLQEMLESDEYSETVQTVFRFLRVELPQLEQEGQSRTYASFAPQQWEPLLMEILELDVSRLRTTDTAHVQHVWKLCCRGRCFADFSVPAGADKAKSAAKSLKTMTEALRDVRGGGMLIQRFDDVRLAEAVGLREEQSWKRFARAWSKMSDH